MNDLKRAVSSFGMPRIILIVFFLLLLAALVLQGASVSLALSQCLVRTGINMVLALAMVPCIISGVGMNFALPLGIECGLLAGIISLQFNMTGLYGVGAALLISVPFSLLVGYLYAQLINRVRGSEMMVGNYVAFAAVSIMCIAWMGLPFTNSALRWPMGNGLRMTITLENWYDRLLNRLWSFNILGVEIPTGLLLVCTAFCFVMWLFLRSRSGNLMRAAGSNPDFARQNGISVDSMRTLGIILSTLFGGFGIIIYAQGFGFYQLYSAPLMMAFPAIAAVLIGGADNTRVSIFNVVFGTFLFQSILTVATPVASNILSEGNLSEVFRMIISNGIILYALSRVKKGRQV